MWIIFLPIFSKTKKTVFLQSDARKNLAYFDSIQSR